MLHASVEHGADIKAELRLAMSWATLSRAASGAKGMNGGT